MAAWKQLTLRGDVIGFDAGQTVYVNLDQIELVRPSGTGSQIYGSALMREGHFVSIFVTEPPTTVLAGETVS
ncbi:hypothetical protein GPL21_33390 [Bradyrhizobium pachyrhizi]|uniref:Uncharacterized protein n=1 Tax=Bradyrhizobium pachyrhizi TaxID=280333 RepID=A0A844T5Q5_9BRAD|nr:hypothetical protein [Bradyrhizobium pachyrhizi]MVT69980.1 hypothetical protein [Bradyrhizobium pachyrhizi]